MTYEIEKRKAGRRPITIAEADLDRCANVYSESHSNLITNPEDFSHADWLKQNGVTIEPNAAVAPDGTLTADKIIMDGTADPAIRQTSSGLTPANKTYFDSFWARIDEGQPTEATLFIYGNSGFEVIQSKAIVLLTEWQLFFISTTFGGSPASTGVACRFDGKESPTADDYFYLWHGQQTEGNVLYDTGVATCTAALSAGNECYNTFKTCQDTPNYTLKVPKTYRFCDGIPPVGINAIPCVDKVTTAPTKITPGKGLGYRANVSIDLVDFPHDDRGIDPYEATRNYDRSIGTFFGKLYARNPFYQGRALRVKSGYVSEDGFDEINDFTTKHYVIEKFDRNSKTGKVRIVAKDPLKLADDERSQCPVASSGALTAAITDVSTSLSVTAGTGSEYGASGIVRINDDIILFASRSTDTLNGLVHAQYGSIAAAHSIDDVVQLCKEFDSVNVTDIAYDLLVNFAGISASFIDTSAWDLEESTWLASHNLTALISEPTGVQKLLNELSVQNQIDIWWDEKTQLIDLQSIIPRNLNTTDAEFNDDNHIIADSVKVLENTKDRISQVWIYWAVRDYSQSLTDIQNFAQLNVRVDATAESADSYGDKRIKKIFSRWFDSGALVGQSASRILNRYNNNQFDITFDMDAKDSDLWTGDHFFLDTQYVQDETGANKSQRVQVASVTEKVLGTLFQYHAVSVLFEGRYAFVAPDALSAVTYTSATDEQKKGYGFIALNTGLFANGDEGYKIL